MAVTLPTLHDRIETTVAAVTPSRVSDVGKFIVTDDLNFARLSEMPAASGLERAFQVMDGEGREGNIQHPGVGEWVQEFVVEIYYPKMADLGSLRRIIMSDFHDVKKALDDPANWGDDVMHQWVPEGQPGLLVGRKAYVRQIAVHVQALIARS